MSYCKIHVRTKLLTPERNCYDDSCDEELDPYCPKCLKIEDSRREREMRKTTNVVMTKNEERPWVPGIELDDRNRPVRISSSFKVLMLPHGGKRVKKWRFAKIDENGYIVESKEPTMYLVVR